MMGCLFSAPREKPAGRDTETSQSVAGGEVRPVPLTNIQYSQLPKSSRTVEYRAGNVNQNGGLPPNSAVSKHCVTSAISIVGELARTKC
jgi:hypothetical protein